MERGENHGNDVKQIEKKHKARAQMIDCKKIVRTEGRETWENRTN